MRMRLARQSAIAATFRTVTKLGGRRADGARKPAERRQGDRGRAELTVFKAPGPPPWQIGYLDRVPRVGSSAITICNHKSAAQPKK